MREFKVVSVDMFGTLVDVNSVRHNVFRILLKNRYTPELADKCWDRASELVFQYYQEKIIRDREYVPLKLIYEMTYTRLFAEIGLDYNPKEAANILARQHSSSTPFGDTLLFLNAVGKVYPVCLSTDTDEDMLGPLRKIYPFCKVFTSEEIGAYKTSADNRFFSEVIQHFNVGPEDIIHIGDTSADIIGSGEAGIVSCWLNRKNNNVPKGTRPDYQVKSLVEAASLLGVNIEMDYEASKG
jgi:FMN phosphatase YigB (HAD superfamily)